MQEAFNTLSGTETGLVDQIAVRVYVHEGRRYCFYFDGWHGPGWYRCGLAWRRGYGWGGVYGWNSWTYGPWERRHHHHGDWHGRPRGDRVGVDSGSTRGRTGAEMRGHSRATTGSGLESNSRMRGTTGRGGTDVQGGGNVRMQSGTSAAPNSAPSGTTGGGASVGGGERR
jgi:hypothetical protein